MSITAKSTLINKMCIILVHIKIKKILIKLYQQKVKKQAVVIQGLINIKKSDIF